MAQPDHERYVTLDGMRGLAALAVVAYHFDGSLVPGGYLAVDFFFALSGFVLAKAYGQRLASGASFWRFIEARLLRLYPLFLAGMLIGTLYTAQHMIRGGSQGLSRNQVIGTVALSYAMIPNPFSAFLYPLNVVFWSIFTEIIINVLFAAMLAKIRSSFLMLIAISAALLLVVITLSTHDLNAGVMWSGFGIAIFRTVFSFTAGMILARAHNGAGRKQSSFVLLLPVALLIPFVISIAESERYYFVLCAIFLVFPALLWAGCRLEPPHRLRWVAALLGDISYALYAIHLPIVQGATFILRHSHESSIVILPLLFTVTTVLAAILTRFWDRPIRMFIADRLRLYRSAIPRRL